MNSTSFEHGLVWNETICINCSGSVTQQPCDEHYFIDSDSPDHLARELTKLKLIIMHLEDELDELREGRQSYVRTSDRDSKKPKEKAKKFTGGVAWKAPKRLN